MEKLSAICKVLLCEIKADFHATFDYIVEESMEKCADREEIQEAMRDQDGKSSGRLICGCRNSKDEMMNLQRLYMENSSNSPCYRKMKIFYKTFKNLCFTMVFGKEGI